MSVTNGVSQQSSRIYFKGKDHKSLYGSLPIDYPTSYNTFTGFYHGLYMQGKDQDRYDLIWRKMYPDRYFIYPTDGPSSEWGYRKGLCYCKEKIVAGFIENSCGYCTGNYWFGNVNQWASSMKVQSSDRRLSKQCTYTPPFREMSSIYPLKNGLVIRDWDSNFQYFRVVDDTKKIFGSLEYVKQLNPAYGSVVYSKDGKIPYIYFIGSEYVSGSTYSLKVQAFSSETEELSSVYTAGARSDGYGFSSISVSANGRLFIPVNYTTHWQPDRNAVKLIELSGTSYTEHFIPGEYSGYGSTGDFMGIKYYNGTYYLYINRNIITTSNFSSYSLSKQLSGGVEIPHITDGSTITLNFEGQGETIYSPSYISGYDMPFYENSKMVDTYDMAFMARRPYAPWTNDVIVYMDNPLMNGNENSFFIRSSDFMSDFGFDGQEMARKYHHMEV